MADPSPGNTKEKTILRRGSNFDLEADPMDISTESKKITKCILVEVFSIQFTGRDHEYAKSTHGVILLKGSNGLHVIFEDRGDGKRSQVNSEGRFTLIGPTCRVEAEDQLVIYPWLFDTCSIDNAGRTLWVNSPSSKIDQLIRKAFDTRIGIIDVNFAVYSNGVEAKLDFDLCNLNLSMLMEKERPVQIYGTIQASNDVVNHPEAKSMLFDHITPEECVTFGPEARDSTKIALPLSRSTTVIPIGSALFVDIRLYLRSAPKDICIINNFVVFKYKQELSATLDLIGNHGTIKVRVTWLV